MKVKVCGLRDLDNIAAIAELRPDYLGFIFYPQSPRVVRNLNPILLQNIDSSVKKIGVFAKSMTAGHVGRNPRSGSPVEVKPMTRISYRPSREVKEKINELSELRNELSNF